MVGRASKRPRLQQGSFLPLEESAEGERMALPHVVDACFPAMYLNELNELHGPVIVVSIADPRQAMGFAADATSYRIWDQNPSPWLIPRIHGAHKRAVGKVQLGLPDLIGPSVAFQMLSSCGVSS